MLIVYLVDQNYIEMNKRLVRRDGKLLGVCEGLGEYLDIDPTIIRILFIVAVLFMGGGILFYLILALIMPKE